MAAKDKNVQPRVVSPIEVSPRLVEPKAIKYPFGGTPPIPPTPPPIDEWWGLKLTMPEGGTVIFRKNSSPNAVNLEVSTDGQNWQPWTLVGTDYSYTLQAGETLCVRNTSETVVPLSRTTADYWYFVLDSTTFASGSIMSLICNNRSITSLGGINYVFARIFKDCKKLISPPLMPATSLSNNCYYYSYSGSGIKEITLDAQILSEGCYRGMFNACADLKTIYTRMEDISATNCLTLWLNFASSTGDFYCPASLTIPTGASGIPSGWTRHDI